MWIFSPTAGTPQTSLVFGTVEAICHKWSMGLLTLRGAGLFLLLGLGYAS